MIKFDNKTIASVFGGEKTIEKIYKGTLKIYEAWKTLIASGVPPLTLLKCKGVDLIDYKIEGNSVQEADTSNIWDGTYTEGTYYDASGNIVTNTRIAMSNMMKLDYSIYDVTAVAENSPGNYSYNVRYNFFDENKKWLSQTIVVVAGSGRTVVEQEIQVPTGAKYINFSILTIEMYAGQKICPSPKNVPTPETPIEIESVGDRTKNLCDNIFKYGTISASSGLETNYTYPTKHIYTPSYIPVNPNYEYTMTNQIANTNQKVRFYDKDKNFIGYQFKRGAWLAQSDDLLIRTGTPPDNACFVRFELVFDSIEIATAVLNGEYVYMLELGPMATEYEPYGYKIPVKVRGTNLYGGKFNEIFKLDSFIPANTTFYAFGDNLSGLCYIGLYDVNQKRVNNLRLNSTYAGRRFIEITEATDIYYVKFHTEELTNLVVTLECNPVYEPYIEHITTNIYLNEPLRKVGDYADYIDFENSKVVRNIRERLLNVFGWKRHNTYSNIYVAEIYGLKHNINPLSNIFDSTTYRPINSITTMSKDYCIKAHSKENKVYISDSVHTTNETFKDFLGDGYMSYVLETPIEETIELPTIPTFKGTTIIEVDTGVQPSNMEVTYKGKN